MPGMPTASRFFASFTPVFAVAVGSGCQFDSSGVLGDRSAGDATPDTPDAPTTIQDSAIPMPDAMPDAMAPQAGVLVARRAPGPVTIDGYDEEFLAANATFASFDMAVAPILIVRVDEYAPSATARFAALHDDHFIYFFTEVEDSILNVDSSALWNDDSVSYFLDASGDASGPPGFDDHEIIVRSDGAWSDLGEMAPPADVLVAARERQGGYYIEARVRKTSLTPTVTDVLGFNVGVTDDDGIEDGRYDALGIWHESERPPCETCCEELDRPMPWCDTTLNGTLVLDD